MSSFKPTALVGAIAIVSGFSSNTFADTATINTDVTPLETLVVTASRSEQKIEDVPARISVIDEKTIESNPILNVSDLIQRDPSIYIKQSGGIGQISEISLRGTKPVHTLLLKDGARINSQNELAPVYSGFLDTTDIKQIEILKGPASVQYGSDAIGGVIQLISKNPEKTGASLTGIYGENKTYKTILNADFVSDTGLYTQIGGQRLESNGTRIFESQSKSDRAGFDQKGYNAKLGYYQENQVDASVAISQNEGTNIFSNDYIRNTAQRQFENQFINAKIAYNLSPDLIINARYSNTQDKQNVPAYESHYNTENNEGDLNLRWNFVAKQNLLFGTTLLNTTYDSNTVTNNSKSIHSTGYYLQHQFKTELLNTQLGVRVEDNQKFGTHTVGQGAIRYQILPAASIYANIGTAFRAPSLNELYSQWGGNENLKPEKSTSYELGLNYNITSNLLANFSAYHTNITNLIAYDKGTNQNIDEATFRGGEVGLKWKKNDFFLSTEYAYLKTENRATSLELAYRPKQTLTLSTGLENTVYGLSMSIISRSNAKASNNAEAQKVPGYATIDLNAYCNINHSIKVFINIQNIGDVAYREVLNTWPSNDWYINSGRLATVGVTLRY